MNVFRNTLLVAAATVGLLAAGAAAPAAAPAAAAIPPAVTGPVTTGTVVTLPAAAVPSAASAAIVPNTIQYVAQGFAGPAGGGMITATVHCPPGTFVVSVSGQTPTLGSISPISTSSPSTPAPTTPSRPANFTTAVVTGFASTEAGLWVMAGCLPAAQLTDAFSGTVNFGSATLFSTKHEVHCPPPDTAHPNGWYAFGGGGYFVKPDNHYSATGLTHQSMPTADGRGWIYRGISNASDKLVVTVQCAPLPGATLMTATTTGLGDAHAAKSCPANYTALSGGVDNLANVHSSWSLKSGWTVSGDSVKESTLTMRAQCIPGSPF